LLYLTEILHFIQNDIYLKLPFVTFVSPLIPFKKCNNICNIIKYPAVIPVHPQNPIGN